MASWEAATFLPTFSGDDAGKEQDETVRRLFAGENFQFGNPLDQFFRSLHDGHLTDEIHSLRRLTAETQAHDAKVWRQTYMDDLLKELVTKRKLYMDAAVKTPPDVPISLPPTKKKSRRRLLEQRARKRYFQELELAQGPPAALTRKQQRHLAKLEASLGSEHVLVAATGSRQAQRGLHLGDHASAEANPYQVSEARFAQLLVPPAGAGARDRQRLELQSLLKPAAGWQAAALGQQTHASFFSLLRDVFCSDPDDRLAERDVYGAVRSWQASPISPLNDWYQREPSWVDALASALAFLSGEVRELQSQINLVPFLDHSREAGVYQWIGAGRDSDIHLESLCAYWIQRKDTIIKPEPPAVDTTGPVPPPLHPTTWVVQPSLPAEKDEYRRQERLRYQTPRRAFTYRLHGYQSVVGPVKGGAGRDARAARGHALLAADRPACVTILTLVRDAVARLPNGQGSRGDVCELVRDSGFLAAGAEAQMTGAVSSALDRLHGEADPCVRYDSHRKLWLYLHRHRSEADFEAIDRQRQLSSTAAVSASPHLVVPRTVGVTSAAAPAPAPASPAQQAAAAVQSVKVVKNQHAIVHIPPKTPGAAPQLALLANGKLIPIVNQPQAVKSELRPLC
ncbi:nuclear factor related to kappa-B-binding protein-like [Pollicipes pollicipes]|uniref:nuclear factor related to kappa-B-binding protein-like n=1 Tax=Pollicipes pollicipes TaxID=41117 RepID=UPI001885019E|nr:nuclear factor related to kappa-B-binding protein-like [Pollicipes pollicipes]